MSAPANRSALPRHPHPTDAINDSEVNADRAVIARIENAEHGYVLSMDFDGSHLRVVSANGSTRLRHSAAGSVDLMDSEAAYLAFMAEYLPDATFGEVWSIGYSLCVEPDGDFFRVVRGGGMVSPEHRHVVSAATFRDGWNVAVAIAVAEVRREMAG